MIREESIQALKEWIFGDTDKDWIKERIKEWIFGILVGLWFFGLFVLAGLLNGGVI